MCGIVANCIIVTRDVVIFMWDDTFNEGLLAHREICNPLGVDEYIILYVILLYTTEQRFLIFQTILLYYKHAF